MPVRHPVYVKVFTDKREMRCGLYGLADKLLVDFDRDAVHTVKVLRISEGAVPLVFQNVRVYGKTPGISAAACRKAVQA